MNDQQAEQEGAPTDEFVGYRPAARYLGLAPNTLGSYMSKGMGPEPLPERRPVGQYLLYVFTRASLDAWKAERPGQGARLDLPAKQAANEPTPVLIEV